jgi:S1-C subfamily serine protease
MRREFMRTAFGLLGILGALIALVIVWIYVLNNPQTQVAIKNVQNAQQQAQAISGHDSHGRPVEWSITLDTENAGGKMSGVVVTSIIAGGAMEKHYGLRKGDLIVEIGPLPVSQMGSAAEAKDLLVGAYQRNDSITVVRDERRMTLPVEAPAPATKKAGASGAGDPLQRQLDAIQPAH